MDTFDELSLVLSEVAGKSVDCGLTDSEMQALLGTWPFQSPPRDSETEASLRRLLELLTLVLWIFGDAASVWLRAPNVGLMGRSPLSLMLNDRAMVATLRDVLRGEVDCP